MIKLVYCIRKRSDISTKQFEDYWLNTHGPKVRGVAEKLGFSRYVQSHVVAPTMNQLLIESRGLLPAFDGLTEVWAESEEALMTAMGGPDGLSAMQMLIEDESQFIDFSGSSVFMTEETTIF